MIQGGVSVVEQSTAVDAAAARIFTDVRVAHRAVCVAALSPLPPRGWTARCSAPGMILTRELCSQHVSA